MCQEHDENMGVKDADAPRAPLDQAPTPPIQEGAEEGLPLEGEMNAEQVHMEVHTRLTMLRKAIARISPEDPELQTIDDMLERMRTHPYELAVVGEFNRGKSSLINALLGMNILPADVTPTTATINRVVYGDAPGARLCMRDGSEESIPFTMLKARVTKLSQESESAASRVREAVISYPTVFCRNNVSILDTPGLNENEQMNDLTLSSTRNADAVIFLISALVPFSQSEAQALVRLLAHSNIRHVLFTVSFIDRLPQAEGVEERLLTSIRKRISRTAFPYIDGDPDLSEEERDRQKAILEQAPILGVSAKKALDAFVSGNLEDLEKSHIEAYKKELMTRLTAQQDEWLSQSVIPYVQKTLPVFNEAVDRRIHALEEQIKMGQARMDDARQSLSTLQVDRKACLDRWAANVRKGFGTKQEILAPLAQIVNDHMAQYSTPGAISAEKGVKGWFKRNGLYRDKKDPATWQLVDAFELVKSTGADLCRAADGLAAEAHSTAYLEVCAQIQQIQERLNSAIYILKADLPPLTLEPPAYPGGAEIFGNQRIQALLDMPVSGISLGSFAGAKASIADKVATMLCTGLENGISRVCQNDFPEIEAITASGDATLTKLDERVESLTANLDNLRKDVQTIQKLF